MKKILMIFLRIFLLTQLIYWLNLDTKLVKMLEKPMTAHYDSIERDHRL